MKAQKWFALISICGKFDFWGAEDINMEVHAPKYHGDNFECALCEYNAKDLERLGKIGNPLSNL